MNFGGIDEEQYSNIESARVLVLPVSYEGTVSYGTGTGAGAMAIVDASRNMELYDEETDAEVYKIGIHTLPEFTPRDTPETMMADLYGYTRKLLELDKFICMLGGEHSVSAPIIKAHNEKYDRRPRRSAGQLRRFTAFACVDYGPGGKGYAHPIGAGRHSLHLW